MGVIEDPNTHDAEFNKSAPIIYSTDIKAQGTSYHAGYFLAGYGYFPYPNVTGMVYKDPDIRKFGLYSY